MVSHLYIYHVHSSMFTSIVLLFRLQCLKGESAYSKDSYWELLSCQRGAEVQSISEKKWCSIQEANKLRKDSLCSNLPSLNQDNLVTHKNCLSTYTLKADIDKRLKSKLSGQSCSKDLLLPKQQRRSEVLKCKWLQHCLFCGEDCDIHVDQKHPDRWRESNKCRTFNRGKGKLSSG